MRIVGLLFGAVACLPIGSNSRSCAWGDHPAAQCDDDAYTWNGAYPECARFQYADGTPIPCQGSVDADYCSFEGDAAGSKSPQPASYHVHVFMPNTDCRDCDEDFQKERSGFTFEGGMALRQELAEQLNKLSAQIRGRAMKDPIDAQRAGSDPSYNQCGDVYNIVAGAPANYHDEPCAFEVDAVTEVRGPFANPDTRQGYPNYSFFVPGDFWLPGLLARVKSWLQSVSDRYGAYDVLLHPNTGCEVRDHIEEKSIEWLGKAYPLNGAIFSCEALGCNQACPANVTRLEPPANCSWKSGVVSVIV